MGASERVEGEKLFHIAGGTAHSVNVQLQNVTLQLDLLLQIVGHISSHYTSILQYLSDLLNSALNSVTA
jgi:hypothetical protein